MMDRTLGYLTEALLILKLTYELLHKGWCKNEDALDGNGNPCESTADEAVSWCLQGAYDCAIYRRESTAEEAKAAYHAIARQLGFDHPEEHTTMITEAILMYNCRPWQTQANILCDIEEAIKSTELRIESKKSLQEVLQVEATAEQPIQIIPTTRRAAEMAQTAHDMLNTVWIQDPDTTDAHGNTCSYDDEEAHFFSMHAVLLHLATKARYPWTCYQLVCEQLCIHLGADLSHLEDLHQAEEEMPDIIDEWQDQQSRTKEEVLAAMKATVDLLQRSMPPGAKQASSWVADR